MESQLAKKFDAYRIREQIVDLGVEKHAVGSERVSDCFLWRPLQNHHHPGTRSYFDTEPTSSYFTEGGDINVMHDQYENSLFSRSLSELFSIQCKSFPIIFAYHIMIF